MDERIRTRLKTVGLPDTELRKFGLIVGACFAVIALWPLLRGNPIRIWAAVASACFIAPALIVPRLLERPYIVWMKIGQVLGRINNAILLGMLFFLVITPMAICMRLFGYDPMRMKKVPDGDTYKIPVKGRSRDHFEQQF